MMSAYAHGEEYAGYAADMHSEPSTKALRRENPEAILAAAAQGGLTELAGALLALERLGK
jgi:hypothetical protein